MSENCADYCIFCDDPQDTKINYIMTHGVCQEHRNIIKAVFLLCSHCNNFIPVNKISHKEPCKVCGQSSFILKYNCNHSYCMKCAGDELLCKICAIEQNTCNSCHKNQGDIILKCKHKICSECNSLINICPICERMCEKCGEEVNIKKTLSCGHKVCETCFKTSKVCFVCSEKCEVCHIRIEIVELSCKHRVCAFCQKKNPKCLLCPSPEVIHKKCLDCIII